MRLSEVEGGWRGTIEPLGVSSFDICVFDKLPSLTGILSDSAGSGEFNLLRFGGGGDSGRTISSGSYALFVLEAVPDSGGKSCLKKQLDRVQLCLPGQGTFLNSPRELNMFLCLCCNSWLYWQRQSELEIPSEASSETVLTHKKYVTQPPMFEFAISGRTIADVHENVIKDLLVFEKSKRPASADVSHTLWHIL